MDTLVYCVALFLIAAASDAVWARYTLSVGRHREIEASLWAVGIIFTGLVSVDAYIKSRWYVIPVALGAAIGTFLTIRFEKRKKH